MTNTHSTSDRPRAIPDALREPIRPSGNAAKGADQRREPKTYMSREIRNTAAQGPGVARLRSGESTLRDEFSALARARPPVQGGQAAPPLRIAMPAP